MKSWNQYLAENNNDADAARAAMERDARAEISRLNADVQREIGANADAREQARRWRKLLSQLDVDADALEQEGLSRERREEVLGQIAQAATDRISTLTGEGTDLAAALAAAGFDVEAWRKAGKDRKAELLDEFVKGVKDGGARAAELQQELSLRDAAAELGVDPKKLAAIKGLESVKRGKVRVKAEDGTETDQDAWVLADGTTELRGHIEGLGFSLEALAPTVKKDEPQDTLGAPVTGAQKAAAGKANDTSWLG